MFCIDQRDHSTSDIEAQRRELGKSSERAVARGARAVAAVLKVCGGDAVYIGGNIGGRPVSSEPGLVVSICDGQNQDTRHSCVRERSGGWTKGPY